MAVGPDPGVGHHAETGADAWLRYAALDPVAARGYHARLPSTVVIAGDSAVTSNASRELIRGVRGMLGVTLRIESRVPDDGAIILGAAADIRKAAPQLPIASGVSGDGYSLRSASKSLIIAGGTERGALYGTFALLRKIALGEQIDKLDELQSPYAPVRWVNRWENLDGSIERGYGGRSIFWDKGQVREDLNRVSDYGRLLASLGINGCSINNVNTDPRILTPAYLPQIARIAEAFRPWGVRAVISVDFGSPKRQNS